jgi:hypothetical protein
MTGLDQAWAEPVLEIDEHTERGGAIGVDQEIRVLARANRPLSVVSRRPGTTARRLARKCLNSRCAASLMPIRSAGSAGSASP